ncbi:GRAM domain-containing protein 2A [Rhizophlyctis rosea]|nr:GRAM domain-containing protein 2A [Rhizophlyctis rosea]
MSRVEVRLLEAKNLKDQDTLGGQNDAYVELWFDDDYKQRSSVVNNSNNPVWNETFTFQVLGGKHKLTLKALDKDLVGKDDIGSGTIDISRALNGHVIDEWVKLHGGFHIRSHGEIHVVIRAIA